VGRVSIIKVMFIVLVLGVALGTLGYQKINIHLLGIDLQRGADTVMGMRLGLDLQGGSHLVYQAKGSKQIDLAFQDPSPATPDDATLLAKTVNDRLVSLGTTGATVQALSSTDFVITAVSLRPEERDATGTVITLAEADVIRRGLQDTFGPIAVYSESDAAGGGKQIAITFQIPVNAQVPLSREEQVRQVFRDFGKTSAQIRQVDDQHFQITVDTMSPAIVDSSGTVTKIAEADGLQQTLTQRVGAVSSFTVTDLAANVTPDDMAAAMQTIDRRINPFGIAEPVIQLMGENRILVQLPGIKDVEEVKQLIGRTAQLEFKERQCVEKLPISIAGSTYFPCELPDNHIDSDTGLTGEDLAQAYAGTQPNTGLPVVNIQFNSRGTRIFADLTTRLYATLNTTSADRFVVFLDDEEIIAPVVNSPILSGSGYIEGQDFTPERVRTLSIQLQSGRLPVPLELVQEQTVDATLGKDSLLKSLEAGAVGLALVVLFMVMYYKGSGVVASLALIVYTASVLAVFKLVPVTLTLAGIAGFILSVGMAVDANVLIFERMKEELRSGRTLASAIEIGFSRAWPSIRDSNLATIITSLILIWFGQRLGATLLAGFGTTLLIGVLISLFSSLMVSKVLLELFSATPLGRWRSLYTPERLPSAQRPESAPATPGQERN